MNLSFGDLGLATGDLVIQSFAEEIAMLDSGKEFLDPWEGICFVVGFVTIPPPDPALNAE